MPKNFVCLDLTMGDYVDYWKQEFRFLQTAKRVRNMFYKIHREVIEENVKPRRTNKGTKVILKDWWVNACISCMSLSDDKEGSDKTKSELGKSKGSRLANWHIHIIFYSQDLDTENLLHVAHCYRQKWVDKYKIGGHSNNNAIVCDVGKWYYAISQSCIRMSFDSRKGRLPYKVWDSMIETEREKLSEHDNDYLTRQIEKWQTRRLECIEVMKKNYNIISKETVSFAKVFLDLSEEIGLEKACEVLKYIGLGGVLTKDAIQSCFSGLYVPISFIHDLLALRSVYNTTLEADNLDDIIITELRKGKKDEHE